MASGLRLDIEPLAHHGWATVRLTAPAVAVEFVASYTPHDSITDLARAAAELAAGSPEEVVAWNTEPTEYDFRFTTAGGVTRVQVREFPDHRRGRGCSGAPVAEVAGETAAVARALWKGLRRLQGATVTAEAFAAWWGHPFPAGPVGRLGDLVRGRPGPTRPAGGPAVPCRARPPVAFDPRWRTADAVGVARAVDADGAFDRLPLLADALLDAGCDDEAVLGHCHSEGPHVRGCWVVDLVLGRE